ncbi:MAG: DUF4405 domain-containing protein [Chloroflexi bacterium]|nr:DUF4405 domain-containing protein [Chloroflexota bacterium]
MKSKSELSKNTKKRYWIFSGLFFLFLVVTASSLYFLYVPAGYQGGRNPRYNMVILFDRDTWGEIHTWTSFVLSTIILLHVIIHWSWVKNVFWRYLQVWKNKIGANNKMAICNLVDDGLSTVFFLLCLISGLVLFIVPGGPGSDYSQLLYITRGVWKDIHIWTGIGMVLGVVVHLVIHWGWIRKVTRKTFQKSSIPVSAEGSVQPSGLGYWKIGKNSP